MKKITYIIIGLALIVFIAGAIYCWQSYQLPMEIIRETKEVVYLIPKG